MNGLGRGMGKDGITKTIAFQRGLAPNVSRCDKPEV